MDKHLALSGSQVSQLQSEGARLSGSEAIHPPSDILKSLEPIFFSSRSEINDHISHLKLTGKHFTPTMQLRGQAAEI